MEIKSLGRQTDLIFNRFSGELEDLGDFTLIKTPSNPDFHWGNYIIFKNAPKEGDLKKWTKLFDEHFTYYKEPHHYSFTWDIDCSEEAECDEFIQAGFDLESAVVLSTHLLNEPKRINQNIEIKKITTNSQWEAVIDLQCLCVDPKYLNDEFRKFKVNQFYSYRNMVRANLGQWYGAFVEKELIGDLGIFHNKKIGRYQNVGTHPDYRNKGVCGTLVYRAGLMVQEQYGIEKLVMEADPNYHAARIYESLGFKKCETNHSLSWWRGCDS